MPIHVEKRDGGPERAVLCGMCVSVRVLSAVSARWNTDLFASRLGKLIGGWCVAFFRKYGRAPGHSIRHTFDRWAEANRDREFADAVAQFLEYLSAESGRTKAAYSPDQILDVAGEFFNRVRLQALRDGIEIDLERGDVAAADARVQESRKIELGLGSGIDVLTDDAAWEGVFNRQTSCLLDLPAGLRDFYEGDLCEDAFVAWFAPFKSGKSFCLQDLAWRCVEQGIPTAYFECGDLSEPQILQRWGARIMNRPLSVGPRGGMVVRRPTAVYSWKKGGQPAVDYAEDDYYDSDVTAAELKTVRDSVAERVGAGTFKLSCHPAGTLSVAGAQVILDGWAMDEFRPRAILIDYADLMLAPLGIKEPRDQHNAIWKMLRGMAQKNHALVGTVTQCKAGAEDAWMLSRKHFAEDIRKFAHVTSFYSLNQMADEKAAGAYRLGCLMSRTRDVDLGRCCFAAGSLACGDPFTVSNW